MVIATTCKSRSSSLPDACSTCPSFVVLSFASTAVARAVVRKLQSKALIRNVEARAKELRDALAGLNSVHSIFKEIRGRGLMIGAELNVARHIEGYSRIGSQSWHFQGKRSAVHRRVTSGHGSDCGARTSVSQRVP